MKKGAVPVEVFLSDEPERLRQTLAQAKRPLKHARPLTRRAGLYSM
ncbi:MAG: hypothetical protein J2P48_21680 [Alphaproteobacteria bacterium]|nr:hypothetical protein [Alphaproteobacteria bacterium]